MRRLAVVAAVALGLALALAAMPGCGLGCPTPEQAAYFERAEEWADRSETGLEDMQTVIGEVETRPELILDEGWRGRLKRVLDELASGHEAMIDVEVPAGVEEIHRSVVRGARKFIEADELFWQGVLDVDAETIDRGNETFWEAARLMEDVIPIVERFCD